MTRLTAGSGTGRDSRTSAATSPQPVAKAARSRSGSSDPSHCRGRRPCRPSSCTVAAMASTPDLVQSRPWEQGDWPGDRNSASGRRPWSIQRLSVPVERPTPRARTPMAKKSTGSPRRKSRTVRPSCSHAGSVASTRARSRRSRRGLAAAALRASLSVWTRSLSAMRSTVGEDYRRNGETGALAVLADATNGIDTRGHARVQPASLRPTSYR